MNSTNHDGNESPPPEDEDRSLLFGEPKEGREPSGDRQKPRRSGASASSPPSRTSPSAAEPVAEPPDPAGRAGPAASSDAVQRRILALLEAMEKKLADPAADEADPAAAVRTIAGEIAAATEWVNNIKVVNSETLALTGKQIEALKTAQKTHDAALAQLKILQDGLNRVEKSLGATAKGLGERSSELGAVKHELATYYRSWTAQAKTSRAKMETLTKRLDAGDHMVTRLEGSIGPWTDQMEKSIGANSAAQRDAAEKTAGNVEKLDTTGNEFLTKFATARAAALDEARQEWTRIRRWTVPALAITPVLAALSFLVVGAVVQSEFGYFDPYDDTRGWKRVVWGHHGKQVKDCMLKATRTNEVVTCSFDVPPPLAVQQ